MNNSKYEKAMLILTDELKRAATANPYDPDIYNDVVDRLNALHSAGYRCRRRRPWPALAFVVFLLIILLYIVYTIVSAIYFEGVQ